MKNAPTNSQSCEILALCLRDSLALREPVVMFERGPPFETKAGFRGTVLAGYSRDRNSLESGYLLHPERIQGKAAALEVFYGEGRVYLFGFRPQWRG